MSELVERMRKTADALPPPYPEPPHPLYGLLHDGAHAIARLEAKNARAESEIQELRNMLRVAAEAIEGLPEDALGYAESDEYRWPLRDELAGTIRATMDGNPLARIDGQTTP